MYIFSFPLHFPNKADVDQSQDFFNVFGLNYDYFQMINWFKISLVGFQMIVAAQVHDKKMKQCFVLNKLLLLILWV